MNKPSISFFAMNFILLFALIGFIFVVFDLGGFLFIFELVLLLVLLLILTFAMFAVYTGKRLGWSIIAVSLIVLLLDIFFIFMLTRKFGTYQITATIFAIVGLIVAFLNLMEKEAKPEEQSKVEGYYPYIDKMEPEEQKESKEEIKEELKEQIKKELEAETAAKKEEPKHKAKVQSKKTAQQPKFVASKETGKYHTLKCGWARIMKRKNKIYFYSKRRANAEGFKAHECVI